MHHISKAAAVITLPARTAFAVASAGLRTTVRLVGWAAEQASGQTGTRSAPEVVVPAQEGRAGRIRKTFGDLYWIEEPNGGGPHVVKMWDNQEPGVVSTLTSATRIYDIVVADFVMAVSFYDEPTQSRGLRFVNLSSGQSVDLFPELSPTSLELDGGDLYFFEGASQRLLRIQLPEPG